MRGEEKKKVESKMDCASSESLSQRSHWESGAQGVFARQDRSAWGTWLSLDGEKRRGREKARGEERRMGTSEKKKKQSFFSPRRFFLSFLVADFLPLTFRSYPSVFFFSLFVTKEGRLRFCVCVRF